MSFTSLEQTPLLADNAGADTPLPVRIAGVQWMEILRRKLLFVRNHGELVFATEGVHFVRLQQRVQVESYGIPAILVCVPVLVFLDIDARWWSPALSAVALLLFFAGTRRSGKVDPQAVGSLPLEWLAHQPGYLFFPWDALTVAECGRSTLRLAAGGRQVRFQGKKLRAAAPIVAREAGRHRPLSALQRPASPLMRILRKELW